MARSSDDLIDGLSFRFSRESLENDKNFTHDIRTEDVMNKSQGFYRYVNSSVISGGIQLIVIIVIGDEEGS
jgi:hypothetical protein